jgi:serine protease Do
MPSIVKVTETGVQQMMDWFGQSAEYEVQGAASGFIIAQNDDELLIATNNHVVKDSTDVTVEFSVDAEDTDDLFVPAKVKGTDPRTDLAVIAVSLDDINEDVLKQLKIAVLGSSDNLKVGQAAITIGNTLGEGISVTSGIISALDVEITVEDGSTFTEFQTDGAANQGQSGGMIVNSKGEVIGIFNAGYLEGDNVGYGIPISTAIPVLQDLINRETRDALDEHGYVGITVTGVSAEAHELYNIPEGAYVYEVSKDSAGDKAGLEKGDIVVEFDGVPIDSQETLLKRVSYYAPGETLEIKVMRQGPGGYEEQTYEVTLDDAPKDMKNSRNQKKPEKNQETPEIPEGQENQDNQDGQDLPSIQFNGGEDNNESF